MAGVTLRQKKTPLSQGTSGASIVWVM